MRICLFKHVRQISIFVSDFLKPDSNWLLAVLGELWKSAVSVSGRHSSKPLEVNEMDKISYIPSAITRSDTLQ